MSARKVMAALFGKRLAPSRSQSEAGQAGTARTAQWFRVRTCHNTIVECGVDGQLRHWRSVDTPRASRLLVFDAGRHQPFAFLLQTDSHAVVTNKLVNERASSIRLLRFIRTADPLVVGFCLPGFHTLLSAPPLPNGIDSGSLSTDKAIMELWETFTLEPVAAYAVPNRGGQSLADRFTAMVPYAQSPARLIDLLESEPLDGQGLHDVVLEHLIGALSRADLDGFATEVIRRPAAATALSRRFVDDPWAGQAFHRIAAWSNDRDQPSTETKLGPELDFLSTAGLDGEYVSVGHRLTAAARRVVGARKRAAVLATARDEGIYLIEWVAYHLAIGFEHIVIYSNNNVDGSDLLLGALARAGIITWIPNDLNVGTAAQSKAYGHAFSMLPEILDYQWILTVDLDEYFTLDAKCFRTVQEYLNLRENQHVDAIALQWLMFGSSGQQDINLGPMLTRFTRRLPYIDAHVKTLCRPHLFIHSKPHVPVCDRWTAPVMRSSKGRILQHEFGGNLPSISEQPEAVSAWINHYFFKSIDEFIWKFSRNRGDHSLHSEGEVFNLTQDFAKAFARQHNDDGNLIDERIRDCCPNLEEHMNVLRHLPGVREAEAVVQTRYYSRLRSLKATLIDSPAAKDPNSAAGIITALLR